MKLKKNVKLKKGVKVKKVKSRVPKKYPRAFTRLV